jgi:hypothetical protein
MKFPFATGRMISFTTWERYIRASTGSDDMKEALIDFIKKEVPREGDLMDCFYVGFALGHFSKSFQTPAAMEDWLRTIVLTRDLNNVPIVQVNGVPVS